MTHLGHGTWLAICDGSKAMLVENVGEHENPNLVIREVMEQQNPPTHELGRAPPGRVFSSGHGGRRAGVTQTDFHDQAERAFLRHFAGRIGQCVGEKRIGALILAAPPRALGMLRPELTDKTRQILAAELARDYVRRPLYEIERLLREEG
jgi:protein required for attachment to host cells